MNLFSKNLIFLSLILIFCSCKDQVPTSSEAAVDAVYINETIRALSSDSMQGRLVGTDGIERAAAYIKNEYSKIGLVPYVGFKDFEDTFKIKTPNTSSGFLTSSNIIGVIPGKTTPEKYIIFSAHYDHIGLLKAVNGDSVANGADDDASGVSAVLALAKYFKKADINGPTLLFAAFSAEELGLIGSQNFVREIDPNKVVAMVNIEMIGKVAKKGPKSAFITGFDKSNFGQILQNNAKAKGFNFFPDPYVEQNLFLRSDNASFARAGVPAHTISTVQIDKDIYYHTVDDEISTVDTGNIASTVRAIIVGTTSIVEGKETPTRVK